MLELLVTLAVTAVVVAIVVPAYSALLSRSRLTAQTNRLLVAMAHARQVAVTHGTWVTFCAGSVAGGCDGDWSRGTWMVFIDRNHDGELDYDDRPQSTRSQPSWPTDLKVAGNGPFRTAVVFGPSGAAAWRSGAFAAGRLRVCVDDDIDRNARDLVLIGSGRVVSEPHDFDGSCPQP
ncbi:GspH/FimT family protein [Solimonas marina]|uniref:Type II secretion system protein H n=1 Tax=Solimonas marina TaxID=2714601 RepID=A0A969W9E4_9GAMM|nr:GspH/FimT family protein [Solimonas marina]NKF23171.1 pilus assembly protein [Solimonas marina]